MQTVAARIAVVYDLFQAGSLPLGSLQDPKASPARTVCDHLRDILDKHAHDGTCRNDAECALNQLCAGSRVDLVRMQQIRNTVRVATAQRAGVERIAVVRANRFAAGQSLAPVLPLIPQNWEAMKSHEVRWLWYRAVHAVGAHLSLRGVIMTYSFAADPMDRAEFEFIRAAFADHPEVGAHEVLYQGPDGALVQTTASPAVDPTQVRWAEAFYVLDRCLEGFYHALRRRELGNPNAVPHLSLQYDIGGTPIEALLVGRYFPALLQPKK